MKHAVSNLNLPVHVPIRAEWSADNPRARLSLDREISRFESVHFLWLRFPAELEQSFEAATVVRRSRQIFILGIFCVILFNAFALCDYFLFDRDFTRSLTLRLCFATPWAVAVLVGLRSGRMTKWMRESSIVLIALVFTIPILYLYSNISAVTSAYALFDLMLVVMFVNLGMQIRSVYGLAGSALCGILGGVFIHLDRWLTGPEKLESVAVLISGTLLSLLGNHVIEYQERLNFLFRARSVLHAEELAAANASLQRAANEDELTMISNRRHFEEVYKQTWERSITAESALSVIMIDIDHFKRLNDQYGHVHGDGVLNRIAAILREDLRARGDFVARYGGEEFIVVLANSSPEIAWRVAQRLRSLIETAGRAAGDSTEAFDQGWTTISCGVATAVPRESMEPRSLIVQADAALYHAKAEGRNRVWPARFAVSERLLA